MKELGKMLKILSIRIEIDPDCNFINVNIYLYIYPPCCSASQTLVGPYGPTV